jgi:predicted ATPase
MRLTEKSKQYLIIGGPSAGKTTIIGRLKELGYTTVDDTARKLILDSRTPKPTENRAAFQQALIQAQLAAEQASVVNHTVPVFLDGGVFDGCAYYICDNLPVPDIYDTIDSSRYRKAFLLESLDFYVDDGVRYQDAKFTNKITSVLERCYQERAIEVVRVPNLPVANRLKIILSQINLE